jgi:hypothetical protein
MRGIVSLLWNLGPLVLELCRKPLKRSSNKWPPGCWSNSDHPGPCGHASLPLCAATRPNLLKCREMCYRQNTSIFRNFASSRNLQQPIVLPSHGRGRWFDPSIAHSQDTSFCRLNMAGKRRSWKHSGASVRQPCSNAARLRVQPMCGKEAEGPSGLLRVVHALAHFLLGDYRQARPAEAHRDRIVSC